MVTIPCGSTMGHGERCAEGRLCDQCQEIVRLRSSEPAPARGFVIKLTGAKNEVPIFYNWAQGTTLATVFDDKTKKRVATALGHIHAIGPAFLVTETVEEILHILDMDVRRVVKSNLHLPPKNLS